MLHVLLDHDRVRVYERLVAAAGAEKVEEGVRGEEGEEGEGGDGVVGDVLPGEAVEVS